MDPAGGAAANPPITSAWGVRMYPTRGGRRPRSGTALIIETTDVDIYTGQEYRIDVSQRGWNAVRPEHHGLPGRGGVRFNAEPYVRTGRVQKVIGI